MHGFILLKKQVVHVMHLLATPVRLQMLRPVHLLVALFSITSLVTHAQTDTSFWFVAPEVSVDNQNFDKPIVFRITTYAQAATVTISQPAGGGMPTQTVNIPANSTQTVDLTTWLNIIENKPPDVVLNYGLRLRSTAPVTIYYEVVSTQCQCNPEIFVLKGQNAFGTDYWIPSQNYLDNNPGYTPTPYSAFDIVATQNNTTVTITPSNNIVGHVLGVPYNITLNAGQTYSATAFSESAALHLGGSRVTSDKPIAITIKDDLMAGTPYGGCSDLGGDQIVPVPLLGTQYIASNGKLNAPGDQLFVMATQNGTTVNKNGTFVATINAGQTQRIPIAGTNAYIETSKPAYVLQMSGVGCEVGLDVLPQINCTGSNSVSFTRSTTEVLTVNVMVRNGGQGSFLVNGAPGVINPGNFVVVPGTGGQYYTCQVDLSATTYPQNSVISVTNATDVFHLSIMHGGLSTGARFGYLSNFGGITAVASTTTQSICTDSTIYLFGNNVVGATYAWTGPGGFSSSQRDPVIPHATTANAGIYTLYVSVLGCATRNDTTKVVVDTLGIVNLGPDILGCDGNTFTLKATDTFPGATFAWSTGATTPDITITQTGTYWLHVTKGGCHDEDTLDAVINPSPIFDAGLDTTICDKDTLQVFISSQPAGTRYLWSTGDTVNNIKIHNTGTYWVLVSIANCFAADTIKVRVVPTPEFKIGTDTLICDYDKALIGATVQGAKYEWNNGATTPYILVDTTGDYWLHVNVDGCIVGDTVHIESIPSPKLDVSNDTAICPHDSLQLHATGAMKYSWTPGYFMDDSTIADPVLHPVRSAYYTVYGFDTVTGCRDTASIQVQVYPEAIITLPDSVVIYPGESYQMNPATNCLYFAWFPFLGLSAPNISNPLASPEASTRYFATGITERGCVAIDSIDVIVNPETLLDVPNAFAPGNGPNNILKVIRRGFATLNYFRIYNRWGTLLYETADIDQGWDGTFNGAPQPEGVYVYVAEAHTRTGRRFYKQGNVTLLR